MPPGVVDGGFADRQIEFRSKEHRTIRCRGSPYQAARAREQRRSAGQALHEVPPGQLWHGDALAAIHGRLRERLNVEHTTVQIEEDGPCQTPECGPPC